MGWLLILFLIAYLLYQSYLIRVVAVGNVRDSGFNLGLRKKGDDYILVGILE